MTRDEEQLIRQVLRGQTESFRWLVERYQGPLFRFVRSLVPDAHQCEDIAPKRRAALLPSFPLTAEVGSRFQDNILAAEPDQLGDSQARLGSDG